eukprot:CAMPEP_0204025832 /NCGR_PEP_ID=MMETSP0360-20130528/43224_1 /ASSEMBLY_ACC=CAM_ASM_000342 /TAXON_ID=268821 /ORGANISM="Scrippsiella Hangoei, Strain SHTV-5" /LENGTH=45 /DNA_ID= /DNA_START= /DNA_END= /DNA_ORIENTATION=
MTIVWARVRARTSDAGECREQETACLSAASLRHGYDVLSGQSNRP